MPTSSISSPLLVQSGEAPPYYRETGRGALTLPLVSPTLVPDHHDYILPPFSVPVMTATVSAMYTAPTSDGVAVYGRYRSAGYQVQPLTSRLGGMVQAGASNSEAFRAAGLDWIADKRPAFFMGADGPISSREHCSIVRSDTDLLLGIHGRGYTPVQNNALVEVLDYLREEAVLESVLSINGGRRVFATAAIHAQEDVLPGDAVRRYLHLFNSHDGSSSFGVFFSDVRLACANQLAYLTGRAIKTAEDSGQGLRRKHTSSVTDFAANLPRMIDLERRAFHNSIQELQTMTTIGLSPERARRILEATFANKLAKPITDKETKEERPRVLADLPEVDTIRSHYRGDTGMGINDLDGARGTVYGLYNAITQYFTHDAGRVKDETERARARLISLWGGESAKCLAVAREACLAA